MNFKVKISLISLLIISFFAKSQDDIIHENQAWVGYVSNGKVSDKFSILNDAHFVPNSFLILRSGATYHFQVSKKLKGTTTLGYANVWLYPPKHSDDEPTRTEYRPWGQTTLTHNFKKINILYRLRYDARFRQKTEHKQLIDAYSFNWRLRYFFQLRYPLWSSEKGSQYYAFTSDEILYDIGKNIKNNFRLNQNRYTIGIGYRANKHWAVQLGYLNMLKKSPTKNSLTMAHTASLMVFHNFDF